MKYAAYDALSIYGIGDTPEQAIANARLEVDESDEFAERIERDGWDGNRQTFDINDDGFLFATTSA